MKNKVLNIGVFLLALVSSGFMNAQKADDFYADSSSHKIQYLDAINTGHSDICGWRFNNRFIFMSNRPSPRYSSLIKYTDPLTSKKFYALYYSVINENDSMIDFTTPKLYSKELKIKYNDGPIAMTPDGKRMIVTENVVKKKKASKDKDKGQYQYILQLYEYTYNQEKKKWDNKQPFPYNSQDYNCAHAYLSRDGRKLYFSSDMPGGYGGMDIYVSNLENSSWGKPTNMGNSINTPYNEIFPSLSGTESFLYFSSNQPGGMGGLDVYSADPEPRKTVKVKNLGYPINSTADDFGLIYYEGEEEGYFCSNRRVAGQKLDDKNDSINDNIYSLKSENVIFNILVIDSASKIPLYTKVNVIADEEQIAFDSKDEAYVTALRKPNYMAKIEMPRFGEFDRAIVPNKREPAIVLEIPLCPRIEGIVHDGKGRPLANVDIKISSKSGKEFFLRTGSDGSFRQECVSIDEEYTIHGTLGSLYTSATGNVTTPKNPNELEPVYPVSLTMNLVKRFTLAAHTLFDLDKYNIRSDAEEELNRIIPALIDRPGIKITLIGHTDSRGSQGYNQRLSENRANSVKDYLVTHGISSKRIIARGYGFKQLINKCKPRVKCSEEEHQENRRVEFIFQE